MAALRPSSSKSETLCAKMDRRMKKFPTFLISGLLSVPSMVCSAETAQARFFCLSLRFQQAIDTTGIYTLDLSTIGFQGTPNGELAPTPSQPDHGSNFRLYDAVLDEIVQEGALSLNVLRFTDPNTNGYADFFEVSQLAFGVSTGRYSSAIDSGTIQATWNRTAGTKEGICVLKLNSPTFGPLGEFKHSFELIEYTGPLSYISSATNVSGTVNLAKTGDPSSRLVGPVLFIKSPTNQLNALELQSGVWTNAFAQGLTYTNDVFVRNQVFLTNYFGFVNFADGDLATSEPDYLAWGLSINDPNDSNGNGIPDFSEPVDSAHPRPPLLTLTGASTDLSLRISGTVGHTHEVQQIVSLSQTNWTTASSITLTSDPQVITLALPTNATSFWRVRAL
jgi:hypothetical protein